MSYVIILFLILGLGVIHAFLGGIEMAAALPAYGLIGVAAFLSIIYLRRPRVEGSKLALVSAIALAGWIALRALYSPVEYIAAKELYLALTCLIIYLIFSIYLTAPRERLIFLCAIFLVAVAQGLVALYQFRQDPFFSMWMVERSRFAGTSSGFFNNPIHAAAFHYVTILFCGGIVLWARWPLPAKIIICAVALFSGAAMVVAGADSPFLAAAVGAATFLGASAFILANYFLWNRLLVTGAVLIVTGGIFGGGWFLVNHPMFQQISGSSFQHFETEAHWRLSAWDAAIQQIPIQPITGTGAGTYLYYGREFRNPWNQFDTQYAHNEYLEIVAEYGIIGGLLTVFFIVTHIRAGWLGYRRLGFERLIMSGRRESNALALNIGAASVFPAILVGSVFDFPMQIPAVAVVAAFACAILANPGSQERRKRNTKITRLSYLARAILPLTGIFLIYAAATRAPSEVHSYFGKVYLIHKDKPVAAVREFETALEMDQRNPHTWYFLGEAHRRNGDSASLPIIAMDAYLEAQPPLLQSIELFPQNSSPHASLALLYQALGEEELAEKHWKIGLGLDPHESRMRAFYGLYLQRAGKLREAWREYNLALYYDPPPNIRRFVRANQQLVGPKLRELGRQGYYKDKGEPEEPIVPVVYDFGKRPPRTIDYFFEES